LREKSSPITLIKANRPVKGYGPSNRYGLCARNRLPSAARNFFPVQVFFRIAPQTPAFKQKSGAACAPRPVRQSLKIRNLPPGFAARFIRIQPRWRIYRRVCVQYRPFISFLQALCAPCWAFRVPVWRSVRLWLQTLYGAARGLKTRLVLPVVAGLGVLACKKRWPHFQKTIACVARL